MFFFLNLNVFRILFLLVMLFANKIGRSPTEIKSKVLVSVSVENVLNSVSAELGQKIEKFCPTEIFG